MSEQGALSHPEGADTVDAARLLDHSGRLVVGVDGSEGSMAALHEEYRFFDATACPDCNRAALHRKIKTPPGCGHGTGKKQK